MTPLPEVSSIPYPLPHMTPERWQVARGAELAELYDTRDLSTALPKKSAVYMWKWNLRFPGPHLATSQDFLSWIDHLLVKPQGRASDARLSHFLRLNSIELSGSGLPDAKRQALQVFLRNRHNYRWLRRYIEDLAVYTPALYAGETGNLRTRVAEHISGSSDFGHLVNTNDGLRWTDLDLHYYLIGPPTEHPNEIRKSLEYITAVLAIAGFASRPG